MFNITKQAGLSATTLVTISLSQLASAAIITGISPEPGIYSIAGQSVATPNPGNGEFVGDGNTNVLSILQKHYFAALPGPSVAPVDIVMTVSGTVLGTTE